MPPARLGVGAMSSEAFSYWKPGGDEERQIRVFISHRWGGDRELYTRVLETLRSQGHAIQDISLSEELQMRGPRGGDLPKMEIQAEVAARIYTADLLIAPSKPAVSRSDWVTWEVQLAAVGYGVPILFVKEAEARYNSRLVSEVAAIGAPHALAVRTTESIVRAAIQLVNGRPVWGFREAEPDPTLRFRGPPRAVRDSVLKRFPLTPRLAALAQTPPPVKPSIWDRLTGKAKSGEEGAGSSA